MPTAAQQEMILKDLLYMMLPALLMAAGVMAAFVWTGGVKQAAAGAALALMAGSVFGFAVRDIGPLVMDEKSELAWSVWPHILTTISGTSTWNRFPWVILAVLCVGRLARVSDGHSSDGWLLRGGTAIGIAWWLLPEFAREEKVWLAPAFAGVVGLLWVLLDYAGDKPGSVSIGGCLVFTLWTAGGVLIFAASKRLMDPMIVLAFALLGITIIAYLRGVEVGGAMPALAVAVPGMMLMGYLTTATDRVHWSAFALPVSAPFTLVLTMPFMQGPKWRLHLMRIVLVLIPLAIAMQIAMEAGPLPEGDGDDWE
jgi:hypothetical protein